MKPTSVQEVVDAVRAAAAGNQKLTPGREHRETCLYTGLDLSQMASVVDYPARDMTITVQAGMPVSELTEILNAEGQQLPIDVVDPTTSVGAMVADNISGPRQYGYGTLRDYIIGLEAVDGTGRVFHAGGRVVKNVAGYDLCRLMTGSRGTLGILTQLTFKLKPVPDFSAGIKFAFSDFAALNTSLEKLNTTAASPVILDFRAGAAVADERPTLFVAVEGSQQACDWQTDQLKSDCGAAATSVEMASPGDILEYCRKPDRNWRPTDLYLKVLPSRLADVAGQLSEHGYPCGGHAGNGIIYISKLSNDAELRSVCRGITEQWGGYLTEWSDTDPSQNGEQLCRQLRRTFDPHSIFA